MDTIKNSADFKLVSRLGEKWVSKSFIMQILKHDEDNSAFRLGLTASRKVGNAVIRNRAKRRLREIVHLYPSKNKLNGLDIVIIARSAINDYDFSLMQRDFAWCLEKLGIK